MVALRSYTHHQPRRLRLSPDPRFIRRHQGHDRIHRLSPRPRRRIFPAMVPTRL